MVEDSTWIEDGAETVADCEWRWHENRAQSATDLANARYIVTACNAFPELVEALAKARDTFDRYAGLHSTKGTPDGDAKALTNRALAEEFAALLTRIESNQP